MEEMQAVVVTFWGKRGTQREKEIRAKGGRTEEKEYQHGLLLA